jgi:folate-binding protein YgfZ
VNQTPSVSSLQGVAQLDHLGVIRIAGDDAAKFIHGQLTQDFALLGQETARLCAFCSAKGRMQASFIGFKRPNGDILLVGSADLVPATAKRLSMFVMRAKAKVTDATAEFSICGLAGNAIKVIADGTNSAWAKADLEEATVVNLYPALGINRQLWVAPVGSNPPAGDVIARGLWAWGEVHSGVATLSAPLVEAFVPQMLNYESVGGVNFKKGCYPGQEVVARSQFRGTLKRRAYLVHCADEMQAGQSIFAPDDSEQPVAAVVQAAAAPSGGFDAIISGQTSAIDAGALHLGDSAGPQLFVLPLPYLLLDDI